MNDDAGTAALTGATRPTAESWVRSTVWLLLANVFRNVGLIALLILIARYTTPEDVGRYALALAITAPIFVFAEFGLRTVYLTMHKDHPFSSYLLVRVAATALALVVSSGVATVTAPEFLSTVTLVALIKWFDSVSDVLSAPMQRFGCTRGIAWGYGVLALLTTTLGWTSLALSHDLDTSLLAVAVGSFLVAVGVMTPTARLALGRNKLLSRDTSPELPRGAQGWQAVLRAGLPTGVSWALLSLVSTIPQYFLTAIHGAASAGLFAILLYVVAAVELFLNALAQSWIPRARDLLHVSHGRQELVHEAARMALRWTGVFVPLAIAGIWLSALLLPIVFGSDFTLSLEAALPLTVCVVIAPAVFFGSMAVAVRNFYRLGAALGLVAVLTCVVSCLVMIPALGVPGALWSIVAAYAIRAVVAFLIVSVERSHR